MSELAGGDRNREGKLEIPRLLTPVEKAEMQRRKQTLLDKWARSGEHAKVKALVATMLLGFGSRAATEEEQDVINSQYAYALARIPTWAVERACMRFASGQVTAADVGAKTLDLTWGPSTAMIARVAESLYRPIYAEVAQIADVLNGVPAPRTESDEQRAAGKAAVAAMVDEVKRKSESAFLEERAVDARREASTRERQRAQIAARRQEYADAGLEPPGGGTFTSLPMMLKLGWTIQDAPSGHGGRHGRILVRPSAAPKVERRPTQSNEMGS